MVQTSLTDWGIKGSRNNEKKPPGGPLTHEEVGFFD